MSAAAGRLPRLISARYKRPVCQLHQLNRDKLDTELDRWTSDGVVLVAAPAGFGKTCLLSSWAEKRASPVCWVSLDLDANNPVRFWEYAIASAA